MCWKCESISIFCFPHCFLIYFLMTKVVYLIQKTTSFFLPYFCTNLFLLLFFVVYTPIIVYHSYLLVNFIPNPVDKHSTLIYEVKLFKNNFNNFNKFLKLVSAIFYQIFIFSPNDSPLKTVKNIFYFI